jgi:hypothetical protein
VRVWPKFPFTTPSIGERAEEARTVADELTDPQARRRARIRVRPYGGRRAVKMNFVLGCEGVENQAGSEEAAERKGKHSSDLFIVHTDLTHHR